MFDADDFYQLVSSRRDVRGEFLPTPVDPDVLARVFYAAHHAPSVGYSQPWNFILIRSQYKRNAVYQEFLSCRERESEYFTDDRRSLYDRLKLEGILSAPINLCVTCDRSRGGPATLGKTQQPNTDIYSTVCAIQNLWLASRAEGLGLGWVSILRTQFLKELLELPAHVEPIAYLCIGYVSKFHEKPVLEKRGWRNRLPLESLVCLDGWQVAPDNDPLTMAIFKLREQMKNEMS